MLDRPFVCSPAVLDLGHSARNPVHFRVAALVDVGDRSAQIHEVVKDLTGRMSVYRA